MSSAETIIIRTGSIEEVVSLSQKIPEFIDPHNEAEYEKRLKDKNFLIQIAEYDKQAVGFKVGYEKEKDGSFYSWMGAVLPGYRKLGVAQKLAKQQQEWAVKNGYRSIRFKTRNNLKGMLIFGLKNGFNIIAVEKRPKTKEHRIVLEKDLHE